LFVSCKCNEGVCLVAAHDLWDCLSVSYLEGRIHFMLICCHVDVSDMFCFSCP